MKLSYDQAWADGVAMGKAHWSILLAIAGVFLFLPQFALSLFAPFPKVADGEQVTIAMINGYFSKNALLMLLLNIPVWLGQAAVFSLLLSRDTPTVSQTLQRAASMLAPVAILVILLNLILITGFFLLIIPGLYVMGRFAVATPAQMAERLSNPIVALQRSLVLTQGNGWRIAGILILFYVVGYVIALAVGTIFGIMFTVALPGEVATMLSAFIESVLATALLLALLILGTSIYTQLSAAHSKGM
ncbi:MAG: hypothetical protein ACKVOJ_05940 [Sphingomonadaceae bacterium]